MPKISDAQRAAVRGRIIDATIDVASRKGLVDLAISDIIRESGMSAGAIYGHFDGKDALLIEVAERVMIGRSAELMALAHTTPLPTPAQLLRRLIDAMPPEIVDGGLVLQIWGAAGAGGSMRPVAMSAVEKLMKGFEVYLTEWFVARGATRRSAGARARKQVAAFLGLAQGYLVHRAVLGPEASDRYLAAVDSLLADA